MVYRYLLVEPEGHRRVILISLDGSEGPSEWDSLSSSLEQSLQELEIQGPALPFGALIHLRTGSNAPELQGAPDRSARANELLLLCVAKLASAGLTYLACLQEGAGGAPRLGGARFAASSFQGGCFWSLEDAYRWLDARLSDTRTRTYSA